MHKKILTILYVTSLIVALAAVPFVSSCAQPSQPSAPAPAPAAQPQPITLKAVSFYSPDREMCIGLKWLADNVNKSSNGKVKINILGGPEVISMADQPEACRAGTVDVILTPSAFYDSLVPEALGLGVSEYTPWEERKSGFYDWMLDLHKKAGLYYLARGQTNFGFSAYSNKKVAKPQDFVGQKLGITPLWIPFTEALGAVPVQIFEPDLYTSLERGVIDGYMLPEVAVYELGLPKVTKFGINHPFYPACNIVLLVNLNTWNKLPKDMQDLMNQEADKLEHDLWDFFGTYFKQANEKNAAAGIKYITFSPDDAKRYLDLANSSYLEMAKPKINPDNYAKLLKFVKK